MLILRGDINDKIELDNGEITTETVQAFEVGNDAEFKMYYTPPSSTTLSAFSNLLVNHLPNLQEQAGELPGLHLLRTLLP